MCFITIQFISLTPFQATDAPKTIKVKKPQSLFHLLNLKNERIGFESIQGNSYCKYVFYNLKFNICIFVLEQNIKQRRQFQQIFQKQEHKILFFEYDQKMAYSCTGRQRLILFHNVFERTVFGLRSSFLETFRLT
ncbi:unnamed protein product [Paramecium octaurelia]|uniref:Uncharacterized protein n=1 Tax=Paramecium octaurelia TaxID=43137 RepID=A0A8S1SXX0_PAROT|nr:unnamed protein product [Paramecium octaurelia]